MRSELENTLLALLAIHPHASGYELHHVIEASTGHMLTASFSQIYPALKKLHDAGLVEYDLEPIKNRPGKKRYALTVAGETALQEWLASPIDYSRNLNQLDLRIPFIPLMPKEAALALLDAAIAEIEAELADPRGTGRDPQSFGFVDEKAVDMERLNYVWEAAAQRFRDSRTARLSWLCDFRAGIEQRFIS